MAKNYFFLKTETNAQQLRSTSKNQIIMAIYLGEFEELVLLTIAALGANAYGVSIQTDIETRCNRTISIGALHSTISRLEEKGFLTSWLGGATTERGGRSKRFYDVTAAGKKALTESKSLRDELWSVSKAKLATVK